MYISSIYHMMIQIIIDLSKKPWLPFRSVNSGNVSCKVDDNQKMADLSVKKRWKKYNHEKGICHAPISDPRHDSWWAWRPSSQMVWGSVNVVLSASMTTISPMRDGMAGMRSPTATIAIPQAKPVVRPCRIQQGFLWGKQATILTSTWWFWLSMLRFSSTGCILSGFQDHVFFQPLFGAFEGVDRIPVW